jgi:hypothetical protein
MADIIEAGDYRAKAVEGKLTETKGHKAQAAVRFALLDFPGKTITWFGFLEASDKAFEIAMEGLRTAGWKGDDLSDMTMLVEATAPEVVLVVGHEEYEGKTSAKVKFINSAGGVAMKGALQPDQAKSFAERMKGRVLAHNQVTAGAAKAPAPKPTARPVPASSSEVPQHVLDAQANQVEDAPY